MEINKIKMERKGKVVCMCRLIVTKRVLVRGAVRLARVLHIVDVVQKGKEL